MTPGSVLCLGVAAGSPCPRRKHSAFLFELAGGRVLLDAGPGISGTLQGCLPDPDAIRTLVLSHQHSDHVGGLSMLIQGWWVAGRRAPLTVHAPAKAIPALRAWLDATLLFDELIGFPIRWEPLRANEAFEADEIRITPYPTTHLASLERAHGAAHPLTSFEAFSFLLEAGGERVAHSADIGAVADLEPLLAQAVDLLVCEVSHVEPAPLFARLAQSRVGRLVLIHLNQEWWEDPAALVALARAHLGDRAVHIARDGDRFAIG